MTRKIFVANFPYNTTAEELAELFEQHGEVISAKIATDRETGRSRGFGFVEMASDQQAANAIRALNGQELGGRPLAVREAEERGGAPRRSGGGVGGFGHRGGGRSAGGRGGRY